MASTSTQDLPTGASISPSQDQRNTPVNDGPYPSHIRQRESVGVEEDSVDSREEGYDGDRVRLLVGSFNVGNSPITDLAPWLPYGGKGYDLIVVGLQESTYWAPRGSRESPPNYTSSLSPTNSVSPSRGVSPRWAAMQAGDLDDTPPSSCLLSPVPFPATPAHETPQTGVQRRPGSAESGPRSVLGTFAGSDAGRPSTAPSPDLVGTLSSPPPGNLLQRFQGDLAAPETGRVRVRRQMRDDCGDGHGDVPGSRGVSCGDAAARGREGDTRERSVRRGGGGASEATNGAGDLSQKFVRRGRKALEISTLERVVDGSRRPSVPWDNVTPESSASAGSPSGDAVSATASTTSMVGAQRVDAVEARGAGERGARKALWRPFSPALKSPTPSTAKEAAMAQGGKTPAKAGLGATMPSKLPEDNDSDPWEMSSKKDSFPKERMASTSPLLGKEPPKLSGVSRESSITSAVGKESRLAQGLKAMKKRRKEMDVGAQHLRSMLSGHLGPDFEQVISRRRMQMRVKLYLRRSLLDVYREIDGESASENTGIAKIVANKGGLVCKLRLRGTTLCFVSCHLQAHEGQNHLARRNASCVEILQGARLGERRIVDLDSQFHHVFWFGDLNYRINFHLPHEEQCDRVSSLVKARDWAKLWEKDELLRELKAGRLLAGFKTEPPAFAPTFKTIRGQKDGYNTKRVPSYTDRVLWKSLPGHAPNLELQKFSSFPEITSSDHKPVHAAFTVKLTPELVAPSPEGSKRNRRRTRIPAVLEVPRMGQPPPVRLVFEDLEATGLPEAPGGGLRNAFVIFSSDPKHLIKASSSKGKPPKTEIRKRTLDPRWSRKTCQLTVSDPVKLRHSHVCLIVMNRERGAKDEVLGVANFSLAEATWVNSQCLPPAPAATGGSSRPAAFAARLSSIPSLRRGFQSSPQRSRGVRVRSPPKNRARFATVGALYCDDEDDDDDFDDTGIDVDDVDLEEEDADVGAARKGDGVEVGNVPAPEASGDDERLPRCGAPRSDREADLGAGQKLGEDERLPPQRRRPLTRHKSDGWLFQRIFRRNSGRSCRGSELAQVNTPERRRHPSEDSLADDTGGSSTAGVSTELERPALGPVAGRHRRDASKGSATDSASATPRGGKWAGLGERAPSTRRHHAKPFDLLLVRNGLSRGHIRGRCSLLLGPIKDEGGGGGNFLRGSVGFYGVGIGMASVAGDEGDRVGGGGGDLSGPKRLLPGLLRVLRCVGLRGSSAGTTGREVHVGQSQNQSGATGLEGATVGASGKEPLAKPAASRSVVATTVAAQGVRGAGPPHAAVVRKPHSAGT